MKLEHLLAKAVLDKVALNGLLQRPDDTGRAAAIQAMRDQDILERRACRLVRCPVRPMAAVCLQSMSESFDPKTVRRERPPDNPEIRKELKTTAHKRRRFGYWRLGVMLECNGMSVNHKKLYRLYTEVEAWCQTTKGRTRAQGLRAPMPEAPRPG